MSKKTLALMLVLLMAASTACGETPVSDETTAADSSGAPDETTAPEYEYPTLNLGGGNFTILNTAQPYGFYTTLDFDEATGDSVDDAIYERNAFLEERFNFEYEIIEDFSLEEASTALQQAVMANDDVYDIAFIRDYWITGALTQNMLIDLGTVDGFRFDKPWWDGAAMEEAALGSGGQQLYAFTDVSLAEFEGAICVFFSEDILNNMNADLPYDLVREGKWTLDRFEEYLKLGANLNGDESWTWNPDGNSCYGMFTWNQGPSALVIAAGCDFIGKDDDNQAYIACTGEKFFDVAERVINMLSVPGQYLNTNKVDTSGHGISTGRTLMSVSQINGAKGYRDKDVEYGIIPLPKADENQEKYRCLRSYSYLMCMPVTNSIQTESAQIMDAMSYLTYKDVMPEFYGTLLSVKSLRNEDSVEMLDIIRESRCIDIGIPYGWSDPLRNVITNAVGGSSNVSSGLAALTTSTEASIKQIMESLNA